MLILGTLILILSTFNLQTTREVKEIFRIGIVLLLQVGVALYDSIQLDFIAGGLGIYNDMLVVTSYTKAVEGLIFIMGVGFLYALKEHIPRTVGAEGSPKGLPYKSGSLFVNLRKPVELLVLVLLNILGLILFMQWNNFVVIFITLELQSYTLYLIATFFNKSYKSTKSGLLYFLIGSLGSIVVLLGFVLIFGETGLLKLSDLFLVCNGYGGSLNGDTILLAYLFILLGLFLKIGAAPFHNWLINIYANTPTVVTLWISIAAKVSILTVLYTLISNSSFLFVGGAQSLLSSSAALYNIPLLLALVSILSIVFGALGGLGQFTIKRIIAYSGLVNSGYFLFIILSNNNSTLSTYLFNIYQYGITHVVWFILILVNGLYYSNARTFSKLYRNANPAHSGSSPVEFVKDLYGYLFANPYLGFCYFVVLSSLIGIPPLTGFYAKFYVLLTGIQSSYLFLAILVLLSSAVTAYYYIFFVKTIIVTDTNNYTNVVAAWRSHANGAQGFRISPLLAILISVAIMTLLCVTVGLDIANNGTHIVESYYLKANV